MRTVVQKASLELGAAARSDATLEPSAAEAVTVTAPITEVQKTAVHETSLSSDTVQALPIGRTIDQIAALAPAVTTNAPNADIGQLKINGGFAYDNVFLVDGADIDDHYFTNPTNALVIEEAVQETQVLTSNISAEYGRFSGGVVNAITKSGGNEYHGSFRTDFTNDRWQARTPFENDAANGVPLAPNKINETYSGTLGGKMVTDKLWFFAAGRYFKNENQTVLPITGDTFIATDKEPRFEGKLTANINQSHTLQGAYTYSKEELNRVAFDFTIDPFAQEFPSFPTTLWVGTYHGVLSPNLFASLQYSQKKFEFKGSGGTSTDIHDSPFITLDPTLAEYNAPYFDATDPEQRNNRQWTGSLNYFLSTSKLGTHDLKLGGELFRSTEIGGNSQSATGYVFYYVPYAAGAGRQADQGCQWQTSAGLHGLSGRGPTALELAAGPRGRGPPGHVVRLLQRLVEDQRPPFGEPGLAVRDGQRRGPDGSTADEEPLVGPAPRRSLTTSGGTGVTSSPAATASMPAEPTRTISSEGPTSEIPTSSTTSTSGPTGKAATSPPASI